MLDQDNNIKVGDVLEDKLDARLEGIHAELNEHLPAINRIAVAMYDPDTDILKTFVNSTEGGSPLNYYEAPLSQVRSLKELADQHKDRVINDLTVLSDGGKAQAHTQKITEKGYLSSYTVPILHNGQFHGFVFFDASEKGYFSDTTVHKLGVYAQLVGLLCVTEFNSIRTLQAAVKTAREISRYRDEETGGHLVRMANFARFITLELAPRHGLSDEFIEFLYHFAPLHDIGKIAVPDNILLKEGPLESDERKLMQLHVPKGVEIIEKLIGSFHMESLPKIEMLKNIVLCHHENMDGSGYPQGLSGDEIPLEARIVSVADVFDALTSARPYKKAWTNDEAIAFLQERSGSVFDGECVEALVSQREWVEEIQKKFHEDLFG